MKRLDDWLNSFTMYRIILYGLAVLAGAAILLSATGTLNYSTGSLIGSLVLLSVLCLFVNKGLGALYRLPVNQESSLITAFILFFIMVPPRDRAGWLALIVAGVVAMASKYIFTWRHASILNPAAAGALVVSLADIGSAGWWVANRPLFIFSLILGFLILRKLRRFMLFLSFIVPAVVLNLYWLTQGGASVSEAFQTAVISYPVLFLGVFMLTEPSSMPQTQQMRLIFGAIVGLLFASRLRIDFVSASPHMALILGNLYAFLVSDRAAIRLKLVKKTLLAPNILDLAFAPDRNLRFEAGQYMEWTLPGVKLDARGNRRTFTIASSPRETTVHLGLKTCQPGSAFKDTVQELEPGDTVNVSHVAGDFVLPHAQNQKLIFIAGGIGVTPFRAMAANIILKKENRDITLFYLAATDAELVYKEIWTAAAPYGLKLVPLVGGERLSAELLAENAPDYKNSVIYISGPPAMVKAYKKLLKDNGVSSTRIRTDYFSGY